MGIAARIGAGLAGTIVLLAVLAQVFLPGIAARRISARVGRYGIVRGVEVSAWPAVELLWGSADSVRVRAGALSMSPSQAASLLWESRRVSSLELTAPSVQLGPIALTGVSMHKRGGTLSGEGDVTAVAVSAALPPGFDVRLLRSEAGEVVVRASGGLFGLGASVTAVAAASEGRLLVRPAGLLLGALALPLFSDPHVHVDGVGASVQSAQPLTYRLTVAASLG